MILQIEWKMAEYESSTVTNKGETGVIDYQYVRGIPGILKYAEIVSVYFTSIIFGFLHF